MIKNIKGQVLKDWEFLCDCVINCKIPEFRLDKNKQWRCTICGKSTEDIKEQLTKEKKMNQKKKYCINGIEGNQLQPIVDNLIEEDNDCGTLQEICRAVIKKLSKEGNTCSNCIHNAVCLQKQQCELRLNKDFTDAFLATADIENKEALCKIADLHKRINEDVHDTLGSYCIYFDANNKGK